jgi:hypothetical protein
MRMLAPQYADSPNALSIQSGKHLLSVIETFSLRQMIPMHTPISFRTIAAVIASASALLSSHGIAATNWSGNYAYERVYKDASGTPAGELYSVKLGGKDKCRITMTGPKSHEEIICRVSRTSKAATLHFSKFVDPQAAKLNHARRYKKDQRLLTFEKGIEGQPDNTVRTVWHSLRTMDGKKPKGGVRFKRVVG